MQINTDKSRMSDQSLKKNSSGCGKTLLQSQNPNQDLEDFKTFKIYGNATAKHTPIEEISQVMPSSKFFSREQKDSSISHLGKLETIRHLLPQENISHFEILNNQLGCSTSNIDSRKIIVTTKEILDEGSELI